MKQPFDFNELTALCFLTHEQMQQRAAYSVNVALVTRNWLFGCYIAEFEQKGENRASYGKNLITNLSDALQKQGIKGASATNLKQCRSFYLSYQAISQTLSDQSLSVHSERNIFLEQAGDLLMPKFTLSWSHYITLTIGIVLCHRKNDALVELTLPEESNIYASRYQLYLPSKEELRAELQKIEAELSNC